MSYIIIFLCPLASKIYKEPRITKLIQILAVGVIVVSLFNVPRNIPERDLKFMALALPPPHK